MTSTDANTVRLDARDLPPQGRSAWGRIGRVAAVLLIAAWCLLLLAWFALYGVLLPRVGAWKPEIESQVSRALGVTVRIGDIETPSSAWVPALFLSEVLLLDEQGRTVLRLPKVSAALSARSLLSLQPRFEQLLIEGAALEVRRDRQGRFRVAGMAVDAEEPAEDATRFDATDWLLAQGEFAIRGAQLRWVDELRGAPPLVLTEVDFVLRNSLRRHDWRLDATPPEGFGQRWSLRGRFRQGLFSARSDWRSWTGEMYAQFPFTDVAAWRRHVDVPAELMTGQGAARLWIDIDKGRVRGATADVALQGVSLRWPAVQQDMAFTHLEGRLLAQQDPQSVTLGLQQLGFTTAQGLVWPASDMKLVLRHQGPAPKAAGNKPTISAPAASASAPDSAASGGLPATDAAGALPLLELLHERQLVGGEFSAARLDLALLASIASRAPLGQAVHEQLASIAPQGRIEDMKASWDGSLENPQRYRLNARLADLRLAPGVSQGSSWARPGLQGGLVVVEATEAGGQAEIEMAQGALQLPGVFEEPQVPVDAMRARLGWQWRDKGKPSNAASSKTEPKTDRKAESATRELEVTLKQATLRNADLTGDVQGSWRGRWPASGTDPGNLDLTATIADGRADALWRYLPTPLSADVRHYLRKAVRAGRLQDVGLRIKGDLVAFPFEAPGSRGEFRVTGRWRDGALLYVPADGPSPAWPEAVKIDARLKVDGRRVEFSDLRGRVLATDIQKGSGRIDLTSPTVPLSLDLQTRGPAQDLLRYVQATPIDGWTDRVLAAATSTGASALALKLEVPLQGTDPVKVRGSVQLPGNDLQLTAQLPALQAAKGRIDFTERGFTVVGGTAQLLGGDLAVEGGLAASTGLRLNLQGTATVAALRAAPQLQWLAPLTGYLQGQAPYRVAVGTTGGALQWTLTSTLQGLGIDLPAPFTKRPENGWPATPLRVQVTGPAPGAAEVDQIDVQLGRLLQARLMRSARSDGRLLQGAVGVGVSEVPALPRRGLELTAVLDRFDGDEWWAKLGLEGMTAAAAPATSSAGQAADFLPQVVHLRTRQLRFMGRQLDEVDATVAPSGGAAPAGSWRADVTSTQLAGRIDWSPQAKDRQQRVVARLSRLSIPATATESVERVVDDGQTQWPALDVVAEDFELRGRRMGRLSIEADVRDGGRDWQLKRLSLEHADASLNAKGSWTAAPAARPTDERRTTLDFRLDLRDSGSLLARMGYAQALKGGKGALQGTVAWRGSPMSPDIRSMQGQMRLEVQDGQFLKADPGAARLLGVLSLQSLPRRLVLDFRDVFQEGFPFDILDGDVSVSAGVAQTRNLRMRGLQAAVLMEGSADILHETQDLRVMVVPEINAGTASLAYATVNPVLGLGTFLAQIFLRRPLMVASTREFLITGAWDDPKVERVQRSAGPTPEQVERASAAPAPAPASSPASSPASGVRP